MDSFILRVKHIQSGSVITINCLSKKHYDKLYSKYKKRGFKLTWAKDAKKETIYPF